jgi:DNA-binding NarL/FixJ family response regulator
LSERELSVLEELAMGTSTEDIGGKLHVSPHTVRTHIKNILRKLDAHTRAHAVAIAYSEDAIDPDVIGDDE